MTFTTWMKEAYPIPAEEAIYSELEAVQHSLRKWRALRQKITNKHGVIRYGIRIVDACSGGDSLKINETSCALCYRHTRDGFTACKECVLYTVLDNKPCDGSSSTIGIHLPFSVWVRLNDPKPMIKALKKAEKLLLKKET